MIRHWQTTTTLRHVPVDGEPIFLHVSSGNEIKDEDKQESLSLKHLVRWWQQFQYEHSRSTPSANKRLLPIHLYCYVPVRSDNCSHRAYYYAEGKQQLIPFVTEKLLDASEWPFHDRFAFSACSFLVSFVVNPRQIAPALGGRSLAQSYMEVGRLVGQMRNATRTLDWYFYESERLDIAAMKAVFGLNEEDAVLHTTFIGARLLDLQGVNGKSDEEQALTWEEGIL